MRKGWIYLKNHPLGQNHLLLLLHFRSLSFSLCLDLHPLSHGGSLSPMIGLSQKSRRGQRLSGGGIVHLRSLIRCIALICFFVSSSRVKLSLAGKKTPLFAITELKLFPYQNHSTAVKTLTLVILQGPRLRACPLNHKSAHLTDSK